MLLLRIVLPKKNFVECFFKMFVHTFLIQVLVIFATSINRNPKLLRMKKSATAIDVFNNLSQEDRAGVQKPADKFTMFIPCDDIKEVPQKLIVFSKKKEVHPDNENSTDSKHFHSKELIINTASVILSNLPTPDGKFNIHASQLEPNKRRNSASANTFNVNNINRSVFAGGNVNMAPFSAVGTNGELPFVTHLRDEIIRMGNSDNNMDVDICTTTTTTTTSTATDSKNKKGTGDKYIAIVSDAIRQALNESYSDVTKEDAARRFIQKAYDNALNAYKLDEIKTMVETTANKMQSTLSDHSTRICHVETMLEESLSQIDKSNVNSDINPSDMYDTHAKSEDSE